MDKLKSKKSFYIGLTLVLVFILHNAQYIIGSLYEKDENTHFTPFAYKAPFSLSEDNLSYAGIIRHSGNHPSIYRYDPLIKENGGLSFADGNIVNSYLGIFTKISGNINTTYYFGGLIPLLLSIFLIFKLIDVFFQKHSIPISIGISILILCSNFDDVFGIQKFLTGFGFLGEYHNNLLVLGYSQRFPYCQSTIVFFLFWLYRFILFRESSSIKNQIWLLIALIGVQYSYFYYWSFAIPITLAMLFFDKKHPRDFILVLGGYLLLSSHFWFKFYEFNQLDFLEEYRERIKGIEVFPMSGILFFGTLCLLPFINRGRKWFNVLLYLIPFGWVVVIKLLNNSLESFPKLIQIAQFILPLSLLAGAILAGIWNAWKNWAMLSLINYYLIFFFCNLKFVLGYNIQPYHWVYASYFPFLVLNIIVVWKDIINLSRIKYAVVIGSTLTVFFGFLNSYKSAEKNHAFWSISNHETEVIELLKKHPYSVIAGNNMMPLITFTAHADVYLYEGSCSHKRAMYQESAQRFIHPYKLMGYSDSLIVKEYRKYENIRDYHQIVISNNSSARDSLSKVYPDNILGSTEVMWCYFMEPEKYIQKFENSLKKYKHPNYELDYLVIYTPTFKGDYSEIIGEKILENKLFKVYVVRLENAPIKKIK